MEIFNIYDGSSQAGACRIIETVIITHQLDFPFYQEVPFLKKVRSKQFIWINISVLLRLNHIELNYSDLYESHIRIKTSYSCFSFIWQMTQEIYAKARESSLSDVNAFICTSSDRLYISFFHISGLKVGRGRMPNAFNSVLNIPLHNLRICLIFTFSLSVYMVFPWGYMSVNSAPVKPQLQTEISLLCFPPLDSSSLSSL